MLYPETYQVISKNQPLFRFAGLRINNSKFKNLLPNSARGHQLEQNIFISFRGSFYIPEWPLTI